MQRFLLTSRLSFIPRLCGICLICTVAYGILSQPALAENEPFDIETILGNPDEFMENFESNLKTQLDQYLGAGIAVTGLILVVRVGD